LLRGLLHYYYLDVELGLSDMTVAGTSKAAEGRLHTLAAEGALAHLSDVQQGFQSEGTDVLVSAQQRYSRTMKI